MAFVFPANWVSGFNVVVRFGVPLHGHTLPIVCTPRICRKYLLYREVGAEKTMQRMPKGFGIGGFRVPVEIESFLQKKLHS